MNINYPEVPNMITGKDLDYLSDMFHWNLGCYKATANAASTVEHPELKEMLDDAAQTFLGHANEVLAILGGTSNE